MNASVKAVSAPATLDASVTTPVVMTPGAYEKGTDDAFCGARPCCEGLGFRIYDLGLRVEG